MAWAIAAGLVLGKLLGIAGATFLELRLGVGTPPAGVGRSRVWGLLGALIRIALGQWTPSGVTPG